MANPPLKLGAAFLVFLACFLFAASGEDEISGPEVMAGATVELCEGDSRECWANNGPHPVIGYDTNGLDSTMRVRLELDGKLLLQSEVPSQEVTVLMRSPHEFPHGAIASDSHAVRAQVVARSDNRVLAVGPQPST